MPFEIESLKMPAASVLLGLSLVGCVSCPAPPQQAAAPEEAPAPPRTPSLPLVLHPAPRPVDIAAGEVLAFHERIRQMAPAELAREQARLGDNPTDPWAALELALVLSQTRNPPDTARALGLLDNLARSTAPEAAPWQPMARLVQARVLEQRRLEEVIERQNQQARDTQRKLDQLNEKLEVLKGIERNLITRPGAAAPASPGAPALAKGAP